MGWDHRQYGSDQDPLRQSDLGNIASEHSCPKRFAYKKRSDADGTGDVRNVVYGKRDFGSVVHDVIDRWLGRYAPNEGVPQIPPTRLVEQTLMSSWDEFVAGREVIWPKGGPKGEIAKIARGVPMIEGALRYLHRHASEIIAHEASFAVQVDAGGRRAPYWLTGTIDVVFRDRGGRLVLADWKTGKRKIDQVTRRHSYQMSIYAHALSEGVIFPSTMREEVEVELAKGEAAFDAFVDIRGLRVAAFPDDIFLVYLEDYVPYTQRRTKSAGVMCSTVELAQHFGVEVGQKAPYEIGDLRGPAWYRCERTPLDVARLKTSLTNIIGTVRLGRFVEHIGEKTCTKCAFKDVCLNEGYGPDAAEQRDLNSLLRGVDVTGLEDLTETAA